MQSHNEVPLRVNISAFDADACLFSLNRYSRVLLKILDQYWLSFFSEYYLHAYQCISKSIPFVPDEKFKTKLAVVLNQLKTENYDDAPQAELQCVELRKYIHKVTAYTTKTGGASVSDAANIILYVLIQTINSVDPEVFKTLFLKANENLLNTIAMRMREERMVAFMGFVFSNRQSLWLDRSGMETNGTDSIYVTTKYAVDYLNTSMRDIAVTGMLNKTTLGDVLAAKATSEFKRGHTYDCIVDQHTNPTAKHKHVHSIFDSSKLLVTYCLAHDVKQHAAKDLKLTSDKVEFVCDVYDNELPILTPLAATLKRYPDMLPKKVTLRLYHYTGVLNPEPVAIIVGTGVDDPNYDDSIRLMIKMCGIVLSEREKRNVIELLDIPAFLNRTPSKHIPMGLFDKKEKTQTVEGGYLKRKGPE